MKNAVINLSLCLSDIPKEQIKVSEKNGKKYLNITVVGRKEPDQFDNNITVYTSQSKEERAAQTPKTYIGAGKYIEFTGGEASPQAVENMPPYVTTGNPDDLPF